VLPSKDVDGFHPQNVGRFFSKKSFSQMQDLLIPCTPHGIIKLLEYYDFDFTGKNAVVIGRSNIVGKPLSLLLLSKNATVTVCHTKTASLSSVTREADLLVAAIGRARFVKADMVKEGAWVVDVGVNRVPEGLCGDVDFEQVSKKVEAITPVPGGIGPMTICMLLYNTVRVAEWGS
jgi:methylenetetrahydrofolate dehydrogenase (NADP+)/methenyltetrahydrofolate cyclohydrolase